MRSFHRLAAPAFLFVLHGAACDALSYYPYDCADELICEGDPCPGECVPLPPLDFEGPALLWMGAEAHAPLCPPDAPRLVYEGHAELDATFACPTCACTQPTCQLPAAVTASNTMSCQGPQFTTFDAPSGWNGSCVAAPAEIPSSQLRSLAYEPLTQRPCEPVPPAVPEGGPPMPLGWGLFARMCRGEAVDSVCEDAGTTCLPSAEPPPPGFRQCVLYLGQGEAVCPADYPDRFTFYSALDDSRGCTPCSCSETAPAQCEALVSTYQDASCNQLLDTSVLTTAAPGCQDVAPGLTLGSMAATWVTKEPGACTPSGGVPFGEAVPINPKTFCCQPPPGSEG